MKPSFPFILVISAPQTFKSKGYIIHHPLVVLIDSGNTHNFINRSKVKVVHCSIHLVNNFQILTANGGIMKCGGHCDNVKLKIGDYPLNTDMFFIDMGGNDIMFGDEWLRILSIVIMDFRELYMSFVKDYDTHTLHGIKYIPIEIICSHYMEMLLKKGRSNIITQF